MLADNSCPYCGSIMKRGFLIAANGIFWNDHVPGFMCKGPVTLDRSWTSCSKVPCLRCELCETIVVPRGKMADSMGVSGKSGGLQLRCPSCGAQYRYADEAIRADNTVFCQNCNRQFDIERAYVPTLD